MTDWVNIANSAVAPKAPVTSELVTALRDNTVVSTWEFYETVYDATLDGAVSVITTSNFEDGWEYAIRIVDWSHNSGNYLYPCLGVYDEANNEWVDNFFGTDGTAASSWGGNQFMIINLPRVPAASIHGTAQTSSNPATTGPALGAFSKTISWAPQTWWTGASTNENNRVLRNLRFFWTNTTTAPHTPIAQSDAGVIKLYRRKENVSDA